MYRLDDVFSKHMDIMRKLIKPKTASAKSNPQRKRKLDGNSEKANNGARDGNYSKRQKFSGNGIRMMVCDTYGTRGGFPLAIELIDAIQ